MSVLGRNFDLFHLDDFLLLARFAFAFLLFVFELAEIHDLADRRVRVWRNLNQIEAGISGELHGFGGMNHPDIVTIGADQANFGGTDFIIYARSGISSAVARYGVCGLWVHSFDDCRISSPEFRPATRRCFKRHKYRP